MNNMKKIMSFLSLPMVLTIITYILFLNAANLPESLALTLPYISYSFFIIGMLLGLRFNKSKVFFLCLILAASQLLLSNESLDAFDILSLLIPINIFSFSILKERGIFTVWGKIKFGFIITQAFLLWRLLQPQNYDLRLPIHYKLISLNFIDVVAIPQISILLFFIVLLFLSARLYLNPTLTDSSLIGVVILAFTGLLHKDHFLGISLFYGITGLILVLGVVEISYFMAYRDELTGLPTRRALEESMLKLGGKYVIAMVDIDFFKKFNDTFGHDAGDKVLQMVASNLMELTEGGKAFRFGGEEFTILFANKTQAEVIPLLEELRKNIAKKKLAYNKSKAKGTGKIVAKQLGVTISIGVAEKTEKFKNAEEVRQAADKALYKAKKNGRNCVSK